MVEQIFLTVFSFFQWSLQTITNVSNQAWSLLNTSKQIFCEKQSDYLFHHLYLNYFQKM